MHKLVALAIVLVTSSAGASTVHGDQAMSLTYALRYAGVSSTSAKSVRTFKLATADCTKTIGDGANVDDFQCTLGTKHIKDVTAYLLYTAIRGAGFTLSVTDDGKPRVSAKALTCVLDPSKGADDQYTCAADGIVAKPAAPSGGKPGDIVQPLRIEKQ
jgi:hypothetical protein